MKHQKVDRLVVIGLGAYLLQVDLSLHRASGHPCHVLTNYLREHSAVPDKVCDFFWRGIRLDADDRLGSAPRLLRLKLMNQFRHDPVVSASFFPMANDVLRKIARYLDDGQARIDMEAGHLRLTLAYLNAELQRTLGLARASAYKHVEHFNQHDHGKFRSIDEIVGRKWPF